MEADLSTIVMFKSKSGHHLSSSSTYSYYFSYQYEICTDYICQLEMMMVEDCLCCFA